MYCLEFHVHRHLMFKFVAFWSWVLDLSVTCSWEFLVCRCQMVELVALSVQTVNYRVMYCWEFPTHSHRMIELIVVWLWAVDYSIICVSEFLVHRHLMVEFIGNVAKDRLVKTKMTCIDQIIQTDLFKLPGRPLWWCICFVDWCEFMCHLEEHSWKRNVCKSLS